MRMCILIAELNGLKIMAGDVGNAYLEALTKEKVYIIAGPEFGELEGTIMIINKDLRRVEPDIENILQII